MWTDWAAGCALQASSQRCCWRRSPLSQHGRRRLGWDSNDRGLPNPVSAPGEPTGIIAIGHSGLTGNNADPARPGKDTKEFSWATGTVPEVNSVYQRMVAIRPETEGHVFNAAVGGAESKTLAKQATEALAVVPAAAIVIILTIDNDIRCDGSDAEHVGEFGENVGEALRVITETSPDSKIIMVSFFGGLLGRCNRHHGRASGLETVRDWLG